MGWPPETGFQLGKLSVSVYTPGLPTQEQHVMQAAGLIVIHFMRVRRRGSFGNVKPSHAARRRWLPPLPPYLHRGSLLEPGVGHVACPCSGGCGSAFWGHGYL